MKTLRLAAFAAVAAVLFVLLLRNTPSPTSGAGASAAEPSKQPPPESSQISEPVRDSVAEPIPPETPAAPSPSAAPAVTQTPPAAPASIGNESDWELEFAGKSGDEMRAASKQLRAEWALDCEAEADRRFATGQYEVYAQGEQPPLRKSTIYTAARGDELSIRVVEIDVLLDADLCAKERKSTWLLEQARTRP